MANFEAFHQAISLSINFLFLKCAIYVWRLEREHNPSQPHLLFFLISFLKGKLRQFVRGEGGDDFLALVFFTSLRVETITLCIPMIKIVEIILNNYWFGLNIFLGFVLESSISFNNNKVGLEAVLHYYKSKYLRKNIKKNPTCQLLQ